MKAIPPVGTKLDMAIRSAIDNKTKPPGSLGDIEDLAFQIARVQSTLVPAMDRCHLYIFAGDHGIVDEGVSAYPQAVTAQMVSNFLAGGAAANVFARANQVTLDVVDAGIGQKPVGEARLLSRRIGARTRNFRREAAMTSHEVDRALEAGFELGAQALGQALALGEMGIGNTSSATLLAHKLTGHDLDDLVGRGTGLDNTGLGHKRRVLSEAASRTDGRLSGHGALREYGGFEIAMMAGAMRGAAASGKLVLVDGFIATAAALCALEMEAALRDYLVFAHRSAERGHQFILDAMDAKPLLDFSMRLGEGTGALLVWPLLRCAAAMLKYMASFESAGVSGPG